MPSTDTRGTARSSRYAMPGTGIRFRYALPGTDVSTWCNQRLRLSWQAALHPPRAQVLADAPPTPSPALA
eukprot:1357938-Rhodomonas_salina.3